MNAPVVIFGIGNRSRGDDAAGPLLLDGLGGWLKREDLGAQVECLEEYQLQPEHALDLAGRRLVLFVDAREGLAEAIRFETVAMAGCAFPTSTHAFSPGATLVVYRQVTGENPPPAFVLCVRAESFELGAAPGEGTREAMREAERLLRQLCRAPEVARWREAASPSPSPSARSPS